MVKTREKIAAKKRLQKSNYFSRVFFYLYPIVDKTDLFYSIKAMKTTNLVVILPLFLSSVSYVLNLHFLAVSHCFRLRDL